MAERSDIQGYIEERTRGRSDWPSLRYVLVLHASMIAAQLEALRVEQGLTYDDLAARAETSKAQVLRLMSGGYEGMTSKSLVKLAAALGVAPEITFVPLNRGAATARRVSRPPVAASAGSRRRVVRRGPGAQGRRPRAHQSEAKGSRAQLVLRPARRAHARIADPA